MVPDSESGAWILDKMHPQAFEFLNYLERSGKLDGLSRGRVDAAMASSRASVDTVLLELGLVQEKALADAQAAYLGLERIHVGQFPGSLEIAGDVPVDFLQSSGLLPIEIDAAHVTVATARPLQAEAIASLAFFMGREAIVKVAAASELATHLARLVAEDRKPGDGQADDLAASYSAQDEDIERLKDIAREEPIIRLLNRLIGAAVEANASDLHVEPLEDHVRVRMRIDGALQNAEILPKHVQAGLVSRIKILARLNIAEQRLPQDGRIRIPVRGREIDLRVSSTPVLYGESMALRILNKQDVALDFEALGFGQADISKLHALLKAPNGIVLVTGPTGSGKTTTLYAALNLLNQPHAKLFTVEDPIEYHLKGVNQIQVKPQIGLDFAAVLRSVLRQDPDIVMIGEIRDVETARVAVQSSLTGHLVLSTLHTNSAAASVSRLLDMGVEDFLLISTLRGVIAQRLVRLLCSQCKLPEKLSPALARRLQLSPSAKIFKACGCASCHGSGYRGRTIVYELLELTPEFRDLVLKRPGDQELENFAKTQGMKSLFDNAMARVASGDTSLEEVMRVVGTPNP
jgi:general secretion pathway protein E